MRVIILFLLSTSAIAADQWLCIGDATATLAAPMKEEINAPFKAEAFTDSQKFIVSAEGLKRVGEDDYWMQTCDVYEGGFVKCFNKRESFEFGWFNMRTNNTFIMQDVAVRDGEFMYVITAGRCSEL